MGYIVRIDYIQYIKYGMLLTDIVRERSYHKSTAALPSEISHNFAV